MTTKLTLSINKDVVEKAKKVSRHKGKSLSKLIEEYLNKVTEKEQGKNLPVNELSGILKGKIPANVDIKKTKGEYLKTKYGV